MFCRTFVPYFHVVFSLPAQIADIAYQNKDHQAAFDAFNEAIKIDRNFARSYAQAANELVFLGKPEDAIPLAKRAAMLSPRDPSMGMFLWVEGRAYFTIGDYPEAIKALAESVRVQPTFWFAQAWLAAAYALVDRNSEARKTLAPFRKQFPQYNLARITEYYKEEQYQNPTLETASGHLLGGLRKAGLK
jgi:adenylate cyclase